MRHLLGDVGNFCLWASSVMIVVFTVQYSLLAPWWRHSIGITVVGEALCLLAIYVPSLMALADPGEFAHFATSTWYLYLTVGIVVATAVFLGTRIITWELIRRQRGKGGDVLLPSVLAARITELEGIVAEYRERHGETG